MSKTYNPLEMPHELTPELKAYYDNRPLMWRNIWWYMVITTGWSVFGAVINPLITLRLNSPVIGMGERMIGSISSANSYLVSFLVMYFAWKSDHTVSRWGRRIPFLWISAPFTIVTLIMFPYIENVWLLVGVLIVKYFFMDMFYSTVVLLPIDMVPRRLLARVSVLPGILLGLLSFVALRYGMKLADISEKLPFLLGAGAMLVCTLLGGLNIKEPPIREPATESFKPWSALKVGMRDRRMILLMLAVPMMGCLLNLYNTWIWLFAKNILHLTRTEMGASLSWASILGMALGFPCAWLIDRINPYKMAAVFLGLNAGLFLLLMQVSSARGLILVAFMVVLVSGFGPVVNMVVFRSAHPAEVGSVTSSLALINNAFSATMVLISGQLIEGLGHNYKAAFILGLCVSALGFCMLLFYRHLMKKGRLVTKTVYEPIAAVPALAASTVESELKP